MAAYADKEEMVVLGWGPLGGDPYGKYFLLPHSSIVVVVVVVVV